MKSKTVIYLIAIACLLATCTVSFGVEPKQSNIGDFETNLTSDLRSENEILLKNGFSQEDIAILGEYSFNLAILIRTHDFNEEELKGIRDQWVTNRPESREERSKRLKCYHLIDGIGQTDDGIAIVAPHRFDSASTKSIDR